MLIIVSYCDTLYIDSSIPGETPEGEKMGRRKQQTIIEDGEKIKIISRSRSHMNHPNGFTVEIDGKRYHSPLLERQAAIDSALGLWREERRAVAMGDQLWGGVQAHKRWENELKKSRQQTIIEDEENCGEKIMIVSWRKTKSGFGVEVNGRQFSSKINDRRMAIESAIARWRRKKGHGMECTGADLVGRTIVRVFFQKATTETGQVDEFVQIELDDGTRIYPMVQECSPDRHDPHAVVLMRVK